MREPRKSPDGRERAAKDRRGRTCPSFAPRPASGERQAAFPRYITGPSIRAKGEVFTRRRVGFSSRHPPFPIVPAAPHYGRQPFATHIATKEV